MISKSDCQEHIITYAFIGYRCVWKCSCGKTSGRTSKDTFLGANRKVITHLTKVGGDVKQHYRSVLHHELFPPSVKK